jgi:hypothetical protein
MARVRGTNETAELESVIVRVLDKEVGAYGRPRQESSKTARLIAHAILDHQEEHPPRSLVRWD